MCFVQKWLFFEGLLKHYKNRELEFLDLVFFVQKWPFRDAKLFSKKWVVETPIFIVFFGCAFFWPSCQKRGILDTHPKKKKITDS